MRRILILAAAGVLLLLIAVQLAVPPLAENAIEDRLTKNGGSAQVDLRAFPAARLLFKDGDSLKVRAQGIDAPLGRGSLKDLDGFDEVDVRTTDSTAGPFRLSLLTIARREGQDHYTTRIQATVTGAELAAYVGGRLGGLAGGFMPGADRPIPIDLEGVIRSDGGKPRAVAVEGSVAGIPAGALLEAVASALAGRF